MLGNIQWTPTQARSTADVALSSLDVRETGHQAGLQYEWGKAATGESHVQICMTIVHSAQRNTEHAWGCKATA